MLGSNDLATHALPPPIESNLTENGFQGAGIGNIQEFAAQRTQKDFSNNELSMFTCNTLFCKVSKLDLDRGYIGRLLSERVMVKSFPSPELTI